MKIYIAGPVTGYPEGNYTAFARAKEIIASQGHTPVNPRDKGVSGEEGLTWEYLMREALKLMLECEAAYFLEGWEKSKGASFEHQVAQILQMPIEYESKI